MAYLIFAIDYEEMDQKRESLRNAHRDHLRSAGSKLLTSGALLNDEGTKIIGGISLLDTDIKEEAEAFAQNDPYCKSGIRKETKIIRWRRRWKNGMFLENIS